MDEDQCVVFSQYVISISIDFDTAQRIVCHLGSSPFRFLRFFLQLSSSIGGASCFDSAGLLASSEFKYSMSAVLSANLVKVIFSWLPPSAAHMCTASAHCPSQTTRHLARVNKRVEYVHGAEPTILLAARALFESFNDREFGCLLTIADQLMEAWRPELLKDTGVPSAVWVMLEGRMRHDVLRSVGLLFGNGVPLAARRVQRWSRMGLGELPLSPDSFGPYKVYPRRSGATEPIVL